LLAATELTVSEIAAQTASRRSSISRAPSKRKPASRPSLTASGRASAEHVC
jgi:hypothetical protein